MRSRRNTVVLFALTALLLSGSAAPIRSAAEDKGSAVVSRTESDLDNLRVSLDVQKADIRTVLRSLSEYSGKNIVVAKTVEGQVTVHLVDVVWMDALELILRAQGLGWREEAGILRVETLENLAKQEIEAGTADRKKEDIMPLGTKIFAVVYANAAELKPALEKTLTPRGHIEVEPRTNSLIVTDIDERVDAAEKMVKTLDSTTPQVEITAKLVDVDARTARDLGINWDISGLHSSKERISLDGGVRSPSVPDPAGQVRVGVVRNAGVLQAMVQTLESENKADIISNPRITTVNNREARILVGKKIPLIVLDEAGNPVTQLTTIGISLRVTPHINDDNRLTLDLHPEVSDLASQATVQGGIIINTSEADTRVLVEDGETAVIGGLIRTNDSVLKRGIPILRSMPLLKYIFGSESTVKEKRELLIFVTPKIQQPMAQKEG